MKKGRKDLFAEQIRFLNEIPAIDLLRGFQVMLCRLSRERKEMEN